VYFDAGSNKIDVAHYMGQTTPSTTASDYWVVLEGLRIERDTDLRLESGVVYLGNVTGGGSGNPPSAKDLDDQVIYTDPALVFGDIVEVDANNHHKIAVKAYTAEPDDHPQISIVPEGGTDRTMQIQKDGSVLIGNDNHAAGDAKPDLVLHRAARNLTIQRGSNRWELICDPTADGIYLDSGYLTIQDQLNAVSGLQFYDVNTPSSVLFSGATDTDLDADLPQNILGAINHQRTIETGLELYNGSVILEGGEATLGGGTDIDVSECKCVVNGQYQVIAADTLTVTSDAYVYLDSTTSPPEFAQRATMPLPDPDDIPIGYVDTTASVPVSVVDMRMITDNFVRAREIVVGQVGAAGAKLPGAHFKTVGEACAAIKELTDPTSGTAQDFKEWRIVVAGLTEEQSTPIVVPSYCTIEGLSNNDSFGVYWDDDNALFDLTGAKYVTIRNLACGTSLGTSPPSSAPYRVIVHADGGGTTAEFITIENLRTAGGQINGVLNFEDDTLEHARIVGVVSFSCTDWGIRIRDAENVSVVDCHVYKIGTTQSTRIDGITVGTGDNLTSKHCTVRGCTVEAFDGIGIRVYDAVDCGIVDNSVQDAGGIGIVLHGNRSRVANNTINDPDSYGIHLSLGGSARNTVTGNTIIDAADGEATNGHGVVCESDSSTITGNVVEPNSGATNPEGVWLVTNADNNVVVGNDLNGGGVRDQGTNNFHQTATDSDPLNS